MLSFMFATGWALGGSMVAIYFYLAGLVRDRYEFQLHKDGQNVKTLIQILVEEHDELALYKDRFGELESLKEKS